MVQKIFETIRAIAAQGVTIFLVEQNAKLAMQVSQRGYVMESGLITLQDSSAALLNNPMVQQAYLGRFSCLEKAMGCRLSLRGSTLSP